MADGLLFGLIIVLPGYAFDAKKTLEAIIKERYGSCENARYVNFFFKQPGICS